MSQGFFHQQHEMDVSKNRVTPKWMVYNGKRKTLLKWDDLGGKPTIFENTQIQPFVLQQISPPKTCGLMRKASSSGVVVCVASIVVVADPTKGR